MAGGKDSEQTVPASVRTGGQGLDAKHRIFVDLAADYDRWFDDHADVYGAQVRLLKKAVPTEGCQLEIGVGSGRFAAPLGVCCGIDSSLPPARMAIARGVDGCVVQGNTSRTAINPSMPS